MTFKGIKNELQVLEAKEVGWKLFYRICKEGGRVVQGKVTTAFVANSRRDCTYLSTYYRASIDRF
jgi:acyl-CoA thioesterase FadM